MDLDRLRRNWENFGRYDPMFAVLTNLVPGQQHDLDEFFRNGELAVLAAGEELTAHGVDYARGAALDFGCGCGRLSHGLAQWFDSVTGVDIAESMLEFARRHNRNDDKVRFVHNPYPDLRQFGAASFDVVFSAIVLQHMRPEYQQGYLREFMRVLRPGGVLYVQIPTGLRVPGADAAEAPPEERSDERIMEMYGQTPEQVQATVTAAGGEPLYSVADGWAGEGWNSRHYVVRRR